MSHSSTVIRSSICFSRNGWKATLCTPELLTSAIQNSESRSRRAATLDMMQVERWEKRWLDGTLALQRCETYVSVCSADEAPGLRAAQPARYEVSGRYTFTYIVVLTLVSPPHDEIRRLAVQRADPSQLPSTLCPTPLTQVVRVLSYSARRMKGSIFLKSTAW